MADGDDMNPDDAPVTRRYLRESLEIWAGALEAKLEAKLDAKLDARFAVFEHRMSAELARHTKAILEALTTQIGVVDDKYKDLPPRVSRLEDIEVRRAARRRPPRQS